MFHETASDPRPAIRASTIQELMASVDDFAPGMAERVRSRIPIEAMSLIEAAPRMGWVELDVHRHIPAAIWAEFGDEDASDLIVHHVSRVTQSRLLRRIIGGIHFLFGQNPIATLRFAPTAWPLVYRRCGIPMAEAIDGGRVRIVLADVAKEMVTYDAYPVWWASIFRGLIQLGPYRVHAEVLDIDVEKRRLEFRVDWESIER